MRRAARSQPERVIQGERLIVRPVLRAFTDTRVYNACSGAVLGREWNTSGDLQTTSRSPSSLRSHAFKSVWREPAAGARTGRPGSPPRFRAAFELAATDPDTAIALTSEALAGGLAGLVAERLTRGRAAELPALAPQAIEFALTPYLGVEEAKRIAVSTEPQGSGPAR